MRLKPLLTAAALFTAGSVLAQAQTPPPATLPLLVGQGAGASYSVPIQTLLFFTALSFLMRQALGTQAAPPNQVIVGLSLFLTFFVMSPTLDKVYADAWQPYSAGTIPFDEALKRAEVPMRGFMLKQTRQADVALFSRLLNGLLRKDPTHRINAEEAFKRGELPLREFMLKQTRQSDVMLFARLAKLPADVKSEAVPLKVLVPAFVTSELKSAFQIGFMIFIPFLIIDMVVASVLMSLGMMMLSPVLVALPFKLMLFVLADGWNLLLGSLAASFVT